MSASGAKGEQKPSSLRVCFTDSDRKIKIESKKVVKINDELIRIVPAKVVPSIDYDVYIYYGRECIKVKVG